MLIRINLKIFFRNIKSPSLMFGIPILANIFLSCSYLSSSIGQSNSYDFLALFFWMEENNWISRFQSSHWTSWWLYFPLSHFLYFRLLVAHSWKRLKEFPLFPIGLEFEFRVVLNGTLQKHCNYTYSYNPSIKSCNIFI